MQKHANLSKAKEPLYNPSSTEEPTQSLPLLEVPSFMTVEIIHSFEQLVARNSYFTEAIEKALSLLSSGLFTLIGLDLEWDDTLSLIQISFPDITFLIRACNMTESDISLSTLGDLFGCSAFVSVGAGVKFDIALLKTFLKRSNETVGWNIMDLQSFSFATGLVSPSVKDPLSLQKYAQMTLGMTLPKDSEIRCGKWSPEVLSPEQINYAVLDAYASLAIPMKHFPCGLMPCDWGTSIIKSCANLEAVTIKTKGDKLKTVTKTGAEAVTQTDRKKRRFYGKLSPSYDGYKVFSMSGKFVSQTAKSKGEWYIKSGLAVIYDDPDPESTQKAIKLLFQPTKEFNPDEFQLAKLTDRCVCCGATTDFKSIELVSYSIVPPQIKRGLPQHVTSRASHDRVLLCGRCIKLIQPCAQKKVTNLLEQEGLTVRTTSAANVCDKNLHRTRAAANALLQYFSNIDAVKKALESTVDEVASEEASSAGKRKKRLPVSRIVELTTILCVFCKRPDISSLTEEDFQECLHLEPYVTSSDTEMETESSAIETFMMARGISASSMSTPPTKVQKARVQAFVEEWRQLMIDILQPKFLPPGWSVTRDAWNGK